MHASALARRIKAVLLSDKPSVGTIRFGLFRGLRTVAVPRESVQIRLGLWERETYKYIRQAGKSAKWAIDIGAGAGEVSLYFSLRTAAESIIAVEPWTPDIVKRNMSLNEASNITVLKAYLGSQADQIKLDALEVPRTVQGFIKLDADFAELDILKSGELLLREARPLLLVETHSAGLERACADYLSGVGYEVTIVHYAWWRIIIPELRPLEQNRWLWAVPK